ncbi:sodium-dependent phosphate transporter [Alkalihalobacillus alcalophilus ATCC 27647 = CGMCC 1.3604]|uniref:Sodium-dependent phosphate transporter n=1 Tax=Alkalihalobacillus alcalophilus ATCC 27647 = CGMCC 1.3604 TaxID=1218173 RepID=A0A094WIW4_ALKAL|nr:Na/Pi cotransporter family protein [Alkalihalobacillus alcalophilus]KGA95888.1 sodium-dependent phosphate transporter [Alkalihalobacillus alcalophilus ATCC 27647 = CGMCC 1.3604]
MVEIDFQETLFYFLGGLGIFLFGIKFMGEGLKNAAGDRLREILDKMTSNPFKGVLAGILVTVLIQSSTGTTALTVGLVSAGFMTLRQAIGVIMGANIGTTATAFIIGINIGEYSLPILFVGTALIFFFKKPILNYIGQGFFGFGALFYGLGLMSGAMKPLAQLESFSQLTLTMSDNPLLGVLVGTVMTVIIQSSTATIGILQGLMAEGALELSAALPVLLGDNLGTTVTALLAAIGTTIAARRAAMVHVVFNLIGAILFMIMLQPFTLLIAYFQESLGLSGPMTIAFAHGSYNVMNTIIQFPFVGVLAWIVTKIIPGEDKHIDYKPNISPLLVEQSPVCLGQAREEVLKMGSYAIEGLNEATKYLKTKDKKHGELVIQYEEAINTFDHAVTDYLVSMSGHIMSEADTKLHTALVNAVRDIERVGDHMENVKELVDYQLANKFDLSESALDELEEMIELTVSTYTEALEALKTLDKALAKDVLVKEDRIDKMERNLRKKHIKRLNEGTCTGSAGIVFVDIVSNLERIGDHSVNIAQAVLDED